MPFSLSKLFPHFHRVKNARLVFGLEMTFLWLSLLALITVNIIAIRTSRPAYWNGIMKLFSSPFSVSRHIDLASLLWRGGHKQEAAILMTSAQSMAERETRVVGQGGTVNVLGAETLPRDVLTAWQHEESALQQRYFFWQSIADAKPDYRDAYITLASLAFKLGKRDEANRWITKALVLDPNHSPSQSFSRFLQGK